MPSVRRFPVGGLAAIRVFAVVAGRPALDQAVNEGVPRATVPVLAVEERPPTGIRAVCIGPIDRINVDVGFGTYVRTYGVLPSVIQRYFCDRSGHKKKGDDQRPKSLNIPWDFKTTANKELADNHDILARTNEYSPLGLGLCAHVN